MSDWIPDIGALVKHKPSGLLFVVQRRSRRKDASGKVLSVLLWDAPEGCKGRSFPVDECQKHLQIQFWNEVEQFSTGGKTLTICASINEGDVNDIYLSLSSGDRMVSVVIPSNASRVYRAAIELAKVFDGKVIEDLDLQEATTTQWRKEA